MNKVPDPKQAAWSVSHAATVKVFAIGVTIVCDCGAQFHAPTREEVDAKWEDHVGKARSKA